MAADAQGDADARLFVTKVPQTVTKEDIQSHFSRFGSLTDVYLPSLHGVHGTHKGIAFVSFADTGAMQMAMSHAPHEINGNEVVVDVAAPRNMGGAPAQAMGFAPQAQSPAFAPRAEENGDRLFVTKIPPALQLDHLRDHFAQFGDLTDVYMPSVPGSGSHKGICFVSFAAPQSLSLALRHQPHEINGQMVVVDVAAPRSAVGGKGGFGRSGVPMGGAYVGFAPRPPAFGGYGGGPAAGGYGGKGGGGVVVPGRLFVTRVSREMSREDLQTYFQQFGQLQDVFVPTGGKGIAFVSFADPAAAKRVLAQHEHFVLPDQPVTVDQAFDRPPLGGGPSLAGGAYGGGGGKGGASFGHGGAFRPYGGGGAPGGGWNQWSQGGSAGGRYAPY